MNYEDWKTGRIRMLELSNKESHQLTIECIEEALLELMMSKRFNEITVTDIVKRSGISRTAYYKNFNSKEEILRNITLKKSEEFLARVQSCISNGTDNQLVIWTKLFEVAKENEKYLKCMFHSGMGDMLLDCANDFAVRRNPNSGIDNEYMLVYVSGAVYSMVRRWIQTGMKETPEEMAIILNRL